MWSDNWRKHVCPWGKSWYEWFMETEPNYTTMLGLEESLWLNLELKSRLQEKLTLVGNIWETWIFGTYGPPISSYLNDHGEYRPEAFGYGFNNQLLQFNPISKEWTNPKSYGAVPAPSLWCSTTATLHKVWLYQDTGGRRVLFDELYELNMNSLVWTHIQFSPPNQQRRYQSQWSVWINRHPTCSMQWDVHIRVKCQWNMDTGSIIIIMEAV